MILRALIFANLTFTSLVAFGANAKEPRKQFDLKKVKHSGIALESSLYGIYREGPTVFSFPGESSFYIRSTYNPDAKEVDQGFGSLHNPYEGSERIAFEPKDKPRRIRSVLHLSAHWAFLDVMSRQLLVWDEVLKSWQLPADLILDIPRPASDGRGEPTRAETASLRARLTKTLIKEKQNPDLIAGITTIPKKWKDRDGSQYVMWLRAGNNPLFTLKCDQDNFKICQVVRSCFVEGMSGSDIEAINSISLDPKSQNLLLLNRSKGKILELNGNSCHKLRARDAYEIPKDLANAQAIFVDDTNNFWLALRESEGASSASIFTWDAKSW
ncbi:MAG: hypothetical protein H7318_08100 [Oligoflexus sp.]|nr:hypothetical protein [Oligoflexus sp.]